MLLGLGHECQIWLCAQHRYVQYFQSFPMYLEILQGLHPHTMSRYMLEKKNEKSEHTHPYPVDLDPNNIASINH